jgi:hypothetical protein
MTAERLGPAMTEATPHESVREGAAGDRGSGSGQRGLDPCLPKVCRAPQSFILISCQTIM